ncbi:hypothetical protein L1987_75190 [Smallanthus sonchifolius]|uniref:Uncharacterized protein n=1 Tax=Smallanthus sonchifolius TaxID=185202 RepID=A0ACB9A4U3_9ASTR|nr:hypothetical protein L1987_75190 [Smallanthus sonchifolius]
MRITTRRLIGRRDERQALLELKHGLIDEADRLASWVGENNDCCKWAGIVCDNFTHHVHKIHLPDTDEYEYTSITNMQWLSSLRWLHHLDLSNMDLSQATYWLQVINTLPSLVELHLSHSQLVHIDPYVANLNVTSLSLLDLSGNDFNNSYVLQWIFSQTSLLSLDLSGCGLHGPIPSSIGSFHNLTSLESLHVRGNDFMSSSVLKGLSSVGGNPISLDIRSCGISSSVLGALHNLTSILSLELSSNVLNNTIPASLGNLCNLRHIGLDGNSFPDISLTSLLERFLGCKSPRLESLSLAASGLSSHLPNQLGQLIYLESLQLGNNHIDDLGSCSK